MSSLAHQVLSQLIKFSFMMTCVTFQSLSISSKPYVRNKEKWFGFLSFTFILKYLRRGRYNNAIFFLSFLQKKNREPWNISYQKCSRRTSESLFLHPESWNFYSSFLFYSLFFPPRLFFSPPPSPAIPCVKAKKCGTICMDILEDFSLKI